jgi:uncharacterized repeat protein (TIGR01451 family)
VPGEQVSYVITITNAGPSDANAVMVSDPLPPGLTAVSATPDAGFCTAAGTDVSCDLGVVAAAATVSVLVVADVAPDVVDDVTNTATVSTATDDPNPDNNTGSTTNTPEPAADLTIDKTLTTSVVVPGESVTYEVTVTNDGPSAAQSVVVEDPFVAELIPTSASATDGTCAVDGQQVTCTINSIAPEATVTITIEADVAPGAGGDVSNEATVSSATPDPDPSNNSDVAVGTSVRSADIAVVKTAPAVATGGEELLYTLVVSNDGPSTARAVSLTDTLPSGTSFVSASPGCAQSSGVVTCAVGDLAPGAPRSLSIVVTLPNVADTTNLTNSASVTTTTEDPDPSNNESSVTTSVTPDPGTLTGNVWIDADGDGVIDPGEAGIGGVIVIVTGDPDGDGVVNTFTTTTDGLGSYSLVLPHGDWTVALDDNTIPFGTAATTGTTSVISLPLGGSANVDFGRRFGSISGRVWFDTDEDGVIDPGEVDISGVRVTAVCPGPDGVIGTADDLTGSAVTESPYFIGGLPIGQTCNVRVDPSTLPSGLHQTGDPDSVLDGATSVTATEDGTTGVDFGYRRIVDIPGTGSESKQLLRMAFVLLVFGGALFLISRRRRSRIAST